MEASKKAFEEFLDVCDEVTCHEVEILEILKKKFTKAQPTFTQSTEFIDVLKKAQASILSDLKNKYVYIRTVVQHLRAHTNKRKNEFSDSDSDLVNKRQKTVIEEKEKKSPGECSAANTKSDFCNAEKGKIKRPCTPEAKSDGGCDTNGETCTHKPSVEAEQRTNLDIKVDTKCMSCNAKNCDCESPTVTGETSGTKVCMVDSNSTNESECINSHTKISYSPKDAIENVRKLTEDNKDQTKKDSCSGDVKDKIKTHSSTIDLSESLPLKYNADSDNQGMNIRDQETCLISQDNKTEQCSSDTNQGTATDSVNLLSDDKPEADDEVDQHPVHLSDEDTASTSVTEKVNSKFPSGSASISAVKSSAEKTTADGQDVVGDGEPTNKGSSDLQGESSSNMKGSERQIRKLENLLKKLDHKIKKYQAREMSLDDLEEEDSAYIMEDKYKAKFNQVWAKLCQLKGREVTTGRPTQQKFSYHGSRHTAINVKVMKLVNKHDHFPDYQDIRDLVFTTNKKHKLMISPSLLEMEAQRVFREVHQLLRDRRQKDLLWNTGCYLTDLSQTEKDNKEKKDRTERDNQKKKDRGPHDPARQDNTLRDKLEANRKVASNKLQEVIDKFAARQVVQGDHTDDSGTEEPEEQAMSPLPNDDDIEMQDDEEGRKTPQMVTTEPPEAGQGISRVERQVSSPETSSALTVALQKVRDKGHLVPATSATDTDTSLAASCETPSSMLSDADNDDGSDDQRDVGVDHDDGDKDANVEDQEDRSPDFQVINLDSDEKGSASEEMQDDAGEPVSGVVIETASRSPAENSSHAGSATQSSSPKSSELDEPAHSADTFEDKNEEAQDVMEVSVAAMEILDTESSNDPGHVTGTDGVQSSPESGHVTGKDGTQSSPESGHVTDEDGMQSLAEVPKAAAPADDSGNSNVSPAKSVQSDGKSEHQSSVDGNNDDKDDDDDDDECVIILDSDDEDEPSGETNQKSKSQNASPQDHSKVTGKPENSSTPMKKSVYENSVNTATSAVKQQPKQENNKSGGNVTKAQLVQRVSGEQSSHQQVSVSKAQVLDVNRKAGVASGASPLPPGVSVKNNSSSKPANVANNGSQVTPGGGLNNQASTSSPSSDKILPNHMNEDLLRKICMNVQKDLSRSAVARKAAPQAAVNAAKVGRVTPHTYLLTNAKKPAVPAQRQLKIPVNTTTGQVVKYTRPKNVKLLNLANLTPKQASQLSRPKIPGSVVHHFPNPSNNTVNSQVPVRGNAMKRKPVKAPETVSDASSLKIAASYSLQSTVSRSSAKPVTTKTPNGGPIGENNTKLGKGQTDKQNVPRPQKPHQDDDCCIVLSDSD